MKKKKKQQLAIQGTFPPKKGQKGTTGGPRWFFGAEELLGDLHGAELRCNGDLPRFDSFRFEGKYAEGSTRISQKERQSEMFHFKAKGQGE